MHTRSDIFLLFFVIILIGGCAEDRPFLHQASVEELRAQLRQREKSTTTLDQASIEELRAQLHQREALEKQRQEQPSPMPTTTLPSASGMLPAPASAPSVSFPGTAFPPTIGQYQRALIIGNATYADSPLRNPINDATDMAAILRPLGFEVTLVRDADKPTMERAIGDFTRGVPRGSVGLFFFSGHGVQIDGLNYLLPIGTRFTQPTDVNTRPSRRIGSWDVWMIRAWK